jgi:MFS family permease
MISCRVLLGMFEAGLYPGVAFLTTTWYRRRELQVRLTFVFIPAALSGAFGGLLAYAIGKMDGISGLRGWRYNATFTHGDLGINV